MATSNTQLTGGAAPTSAAATPGYDAAGNLVRVQDPRNNVTTMTYNNWGLLSSTVEPSTTAHPNAADRTWTVSYNAAGDPTGELRPGGVSVTRTVDNLGRVTVESASGAGVTAASRSYGYDLGGRLSSAGTQTFSYFDTGALQASSGPSGASSFDIDNVGRVSSRTDAAGTATFQYSDRGELRQYSIGATTVTLTWNPVGQVASVTYPSGVTRTMGYDDLGRLTDDHTRNSSNTTLARRQYGYNADSSVQQAVITQPGNAAAGSYSFSYDLGSRLKGFTGPAGTTTYDYDAAGNRTVVNGATYSYDQRNRLSSGGGTSYIWTPRGTLASTTGTGAAVYSFDALDRLRAAGSTTYTYDDLDRVLTRNGAGGFAYAGAETDPVTAPGESLLRSPTGQLLGIKRGATTVLAGIDRHGDLAWTLNPATGTIADSRVVDPYGRALATTGTTSPLGFQADYTDPTTGNVWMAARWYNPNTGTFLSRDTYPGVIGAVLTLNRYSYALGDPLRYWDPTGRTQVPAGCDNACQWQHFLDTGEIYGDHTYAENEDGTANSGVYVREDERGNVTSVVSPTGVVSVSSSGTVDRSTSPLPYTPNQQTADAIANLVSRGFAPEDIVAAIVPAPSTTGRWADPTRPTMLLVAALGTMSRLATSCPGSCQPPVATDCSLGAAVVMCAPRPTSIDGPCPNVASGGRKFAICDPTGGRKGPDIVCSASRSCSGAVADRGNGKVCSSGSSCDSPVPPGRPTGKACMTISCDGGPAIGSTNCGSLTITRSQACGERGPTIIASTSGSGTDNGNQRPQPGQSNTKPGTTGGSATNPAAKPTGTRDGDLPSRGDPNSSGVKDDGKGNGQIRDYGPDGKAVTDYDFGHDHGVGDPHAHDWEWNNPQKPRGSRGKGRPLKPGE